MGKSDTLLVETDPISGIFSQAAFFLSDANFAASRIQIEFGVIAMGGDNHPWGMYQQALRELRVRVQSLHQLQNEIALAQCEEHRWLAKSRRWAFTESQKIAKVEAALKARGYRYQIQSLSMSYTDVKSELFIIVQKVHEIRETLGVLTEERKRELELSYWVHRISNQARLSLAATGCLDGNLLSLIISTRGALRDAVIKELRGLQLPRPQICYIEEHVEADTDLAIAGQ